MNNETKVDWTTLLPDAPRLAVPPLLGVREDHPRSMRWPVDVADAVEELAKAEGQEFATMALYLLKGAAAEFKAARGKKKNGSKRVAPSKA